jgi:hypothetical protein
MSYFQIKRQRDMNVNPKQALRAYVDQLPLKEQRAFIASAIELIAARMETREPVLIPIVTPGLTHKRETMQNFSTQQNALR